MVTVASANRLYVLFITGWLVLNDHPSHSVHGELGTLRSVSAACFASSSVRNQSHSEISQQTLSLQTMGRPFANHSPAALTMAQRESAFTWLCAMHTGSLTLRTGFPVLPLSIHNPGPGAQPHLAHTLACTSLAASSFHHCPKFDRGLH